MAIHIIFGPGGSGKSLFQMLVIEEQLRTTRRNIVTNLAIDVPKFAAWLEAKYPGRDLDPGGRIRVLQEAETKEFWRIRGPIKWTGNEYDQEEDTGVNGVCYVIDEAGAAGFDATGWSSADGRSTRGVKCAWYLDQQRKFGDDVFASANGRRPDGIAKPFRDKAHAFIKLKNGYQTSLGMFRARGRFQWFKYASEPTQSASPFAQGQFHFGTGIEDCYRTQDGVGVSGTVADKGKRAKGLSPWWLAAAAACVAVAVGGIPRLLGYGAAAYMVPDTAPASVVAPVSGGSVASAGPAQSFDSPQAMPDRVTGYSAGRFAVTWADGWLSWAEAASTPERADMLRRFVPPARPRPLLAQQGGRGDLSVAAVVAE